ncbi:XPG N-terminal [Kalmanozyma brasiliensis GHG001]|uniref:Uncharacterized protein n=1 Tax=Kalmanozyma brasiliensis (strain GHG001) TaxID=1365824 RepID=V5EIJ9_KALBG|nr:XPG N-terminal [Kalmanozyma brasiliensis GHG001]EST04490.1 XPG N-terminal [Kalmanozyma brasiliensis GHG001]
MGVQGLWQLLQPVARPIKIETLEGKRLAIDSSLWLYHFQMAMRDKEGRTLSNAHILGFLWRILKLLFHGVRPVFVFDGGAPVMKRKTLSGRKARKQGAKESHARTAEKLLAAQMRQAAVKHVADGQGQASSSTARNGSASEDAAGLGENTVYFDDLQAGNPRALASRDLQPADPTNSAGPSREGSGSPTKSGGRKIDWHKDPYALPAMEKDLHSVSAANGRKGRKKDYRFATEDELRAVMNTIAPEDLDTTSDLFLSLPAELQYELVGDLRAQSRMTSYKRLQSMLATAPTPIDFSRAQIAGLKTRNDLTQKVLTVTDEIGKANIKVPIRVAGERNKEYVLVRNPGAEGGFVLGVRDAGTTQEKAIDVDHEHEEINITDDEAQRTDSDPEMEMDDVEIPQSASPSRSASRTVDPELDELQKEANPYTRKEKALELLQARAKFHAKQKRREAGLHDDDEDELERARRPRRKRGERPLFIRNQRSSTADSGKSAQQSDWIDVDADADDEGDAFRMMQDVEDELEEDETEDLARAIADSQAGSRSTVVPEAGEADVEMDEDDFEDVQPEAPSTLREVQPVVVPLPRVETDDISAEKPDRMQELAALVGRRKGGDVARAPPPPRKSLAGSLRAARRSTSTTNLLEKPEALPSPEAAPKQSEEVVVAVPIVETPPRPSPANARRMGPPLRSASQQRLEVAAPRPKSATPANSANSANSATPAAAPSAQQEDLPPTPEEVNRQIADGLDAKKADSVDAFELVEAPSMRKDVEAEQIATVPVLEEPEETGVPVSLAAPEDAAQGVQGPGVTENGADPDAVALDNIPSAAAEHISEPTPIDVPPAEIQSAPASRQQTPLEWSPTPSPSPEPVVIGADGFPLPTAEELDALDTDDEDAIARLNADSNEFVAFLSATKGRSLLDVQKEVESEVNALRAEFANSRRSEEDITKQMAQEIQMMLRLFGLPYITAPMEAEAQCAELVSRRLVDGIITDDSDVFLFGGTRIYKNMFNNNKIVECFLLSDMQRELGLDREKLVRLAYYLGSDYTEGLAGVGPVVAMELLALFSGEDGLLKFRDWWMRVQTGKDTEEHTRGKTMRRIKKNLRNKVHLEPSWPEPAVLEAYYAPTVDESDEPFAWGLPDLDSLRTFLGEYLHWPVTKTDQYLLPIIERQNARNRARGNQTTLDRNGFFDTSAGTGIYAGRKKVTYGSNRLQEVINGFRAANKRGGATSARKGNDESSSSDDDEVQVVGARMQTPMVSEEMLGKEMAKRRPIVRRDDAGPGVEASEEDGAARRAELDAAIEALEGAPPGETDSAAATTASKRKKKPAKPRKARGGAKATNNEEALLSSSASSSSEDEPLAVPPPAAKTARTTRGGRGRGRGAARGTTTTTRGRGRGTHTGKGSGARANLHAARNMSLDDIDSLPPSRSPSVDPATLRARSVRRSSSVSSRSSIA